MLSSLSLQPSGSVHGGQLVHKGESSVDSASVDVRVGRVVTKDHLSQQATSCARGCSPLHPLLLWKRGLPPHLSACSRSGSHALAACAHWVPRPLLLPHLRTPESHCAPNSHLIFRNTSSSPPPLPTTTPLNSHSLPIPTYHYSCTSLCSALRICTRTPGWISPYTIRILPLPASFLAPPLAPHLHILSHQSIHRPFSLPSGARTSLSRSCNWNRTFHCPSPLNFSLPPPPHPQDRSRTLRLTERARAVRHRLGSAGLGREGALGRRERVRVGGGWRTAIGF